MGTKALAAATGGAATDRELDVARRQVTPVTCSEYPEVLLQYQYQCSYTPTTRINPLLWRLCLTTITQLSSLVCLV
jgi:hypothetical protein